MIKQVRTSKGAEAITSDQWHVVLSHFAGPQHERPFHRSIHSEHPDRARCLEAARSLRTELTAEAGTVAAGERDEVFVRRPGYKSLRTAKNRKQRSA